MNRLLKLILAILFAGCCWGNVRAQLYVTYSNAGLISEYDADTGALINETLVMGLHQPHGLCLAGGMLYVAQTGNGSIGKYDARTGATINEQFITGLNVPQVVAVDGDDLYVTDFDRSGAARLGKYSAITGATMNPSLVPNLRAPTGLAVTGNKLFVSYGDGLGMVGEFDATNGAVMNQNFGRIITSPRGMAQSGNWLWIADGNNAPAGAIFKLDLETGTSAVSGGLLRPLVTNLDYPTVVAVSGDDLYLATGRDTGVAKYNATTGELINAKFVPPLQDQLSGLAVVPKAPSGKYGWADSKFAVKNTLLNFAFVMAMNGNYLFLCAGVVVTLVVVGLCALLFRRRSPAPTEMIPAQSALDPTNPEVFPQQSPVEESTSAKPPQAKPHSMSALTIVIIFIFVITVVAAAITGYFAYQWAVSSYLGQLQHAASPGTQ